MEIRQLTQAEVERFEEAQANEARCNANGTFFSGYDIEEEGRWIMGVGRYGVMHSLKQQGAGV